MSGLRCTRHPFLFACQRHDNHPDNEVQVLQTCQASRRRYLRCGTARSRRTSSSTVQACVVCFNPIAKEYIKQVIHLTVKAETHTRIRGAVAHIPSMSSLMSGSNGNVKRTATWTVSRAQHFALVVPSSQICRKNKKSKLKLHSRNVSLTSKLLQGVNSTLTSQAFTRANFSRTCASSFSSSHCSVLCVRCLQKTFIISRACHVSHVA